MVEISPGGNVNNIDIIESSGYDSMDRVAQLTLEHGWEFKEYQQAYRIPVSVRYYIDQSDNSQVEVDIGQVDFISGGE
jgi:protein TonB